MHPSAKQVLPTRTQAHPLLQPQRAIGNQAMGRLIQAKLRIGQPNDIYEQEADRVAEQVMRMPENSVISGQPSDVSKENKFIQIKPICPFSNGSSCGEEESIQTKSLSLSITPVVQRQPIEEGEEKLVQAKGLPGQAPRDIPQIITRINALRGTIQRQPQPEPSRFPNFPGFLEAMERNVGENLFNYGHHLYQISVLYPDRPDLLKESFAGYALGRNVLETGFTFAGFEPGTAEKLSLGTGILFKGINFLREGEIVLDFQFDIGHGLKLETNLDLAVNPDGYTEVRKVDVGLGVVGRF